MALPAQLLYTQQLDNFRSSYQVLNDRVRQAVRTQVGDPQRLRVIREQALALLRSAEQHTNVFPPPELAVMRRSIRAMVNDLDTACYRSADPPLLEAPAVVEVVHLKRRGRPRINIDTQWLEAALDLRGPSGVAVAAQVSARTIRRRALDAGLVQPGPSVQERNRARLQQVGAPQLPAHPRTAPSISDMQLDDLIAGTLNIFPSFGRRMIAGHLKALHGLEIPQARITASYERVHGAPALFGNRHIHRQAYRVPGPMSLAHMDGQHGLIRYKIVIHCIIDGFSRFVLGIGAHNNNRAATVLQLFTRVCDEHGVPSRVRADHGVENVDVARFMEDVRGPDRGSFIWGRSVHNTRIERLWYDVTTGFGKKWKRFFMDLEANYGLDPSHPHHIWLLHVLFLDSVNQDAQDWSLAWNSHKLQIQGERQRSPRDMFFFGMLQQGVRGMVRPRAAPEEHVPVDDLPNYGVDWEAIDNGALMSHHHHHNPQDPNINPFLAASTPSQLSVVICDPPNCPFTPDEKQLFFQRISLDPYTSTASRTMVLRRLTWEHALSICADIYRGRHQ